MSEPKVLEVSSSEKKELEKGESGLSSASVGTEARESRQSESAQTGVNLTNLRGVATGNTEERSLRVTRETPSGVYIRRDGAGEGFSRSVDDKKQIVNMILVNEVKKLIAMSDAELKAYFDKLIEDVKKGQYVEVDTTVYPTLESFLASTGEQGTVYLYPVRNSANNYYQYIWENGVWKSLGTTELDLSDYAKLGVIAPEYSASSTYAIGQKVIYNGKLYTCSMAITEAEAWNISHWTEITISGGFIDADSAQSIPGTKTFSEIRIGPKDNHQGIIKQTIYGNEKYLALMDKNGAKLEIGRNFIFTPTFIPSSNDTYDLGSSVNKYRRLFVDKINGKATSELAEYSEIGFPVITPPSSTTLTDAEFTRFKAGCRVNGTFLGVLNPVFMPSGATSFNEVRGKVFYTDSLTTKEAVYSINTNTKVIQIYTGESARSNDYECVRRVNGKQIPAFPTANTEKQVLTIGASGGALSWENPFSPESVSISDGGTISDDTLKELIIGHYPITLNGYTGYYSCDDGTNYQYASTMYDAPTNSIHYNVITINKSTWVVTFHTKNIAL